MISVEDVSKGFGATAALRQVSLTVAPGRLVALQGASGSGKTTLLRIIAGLEQPDEGDVRLDGHSALHLPPGRRGIGFVFQNYALFEHMSVFENVAFGLRVRRPRPGRVELGSRVDDLLGRLGLSGLGPRRPWQLSGGQRQRVALARALAVRPRLLLLDEPFNALDEQMRHELWGWLKQVQADLELTILLVTHDRAEADALADQTVSMKAGRIVGYTPSFQRAPDWLGSDPSRLPGWPQGVTG